MTQLRAQDAGNKLCRFTCMISALPFETPEATVPIPASATSFTDTLALGLTYVFGRYKSHSYQYSEDTAFSKTINRLK